MVSKRLCRKFSFELRFVKFRLLWSLEIVKTTCFRENVNPNPLFSYVSRNLQWFIYYTICHDERLNRLLVTLLILIANTYSLWRTCQWNQATFNPCACGFWSVECPDFVFERHRLGGHFEKGSVCLLARLLLHWQMVTDWHLSDWQAFWRPGRSGICDAFLEKSTQDDGLLLMLFGFALQNTCCCSSNALEEIDCEYIQ